MNTLKTSVKTSINSNVATLNYQLKNPLLNKSQVEETTKYFYSQTVNQKYIHILVNHLKPFSRFQLYNENNKEVNTMEIFLSSSKFCYTNDTLGFNAILQKKLSVKTFIECEISNEITIEHKTNSMSKKFYIRDIEIHFPNYLYPIRNNYLFKNKNSTIYNRFNSYLKNCIENNIIPNKIIFKT